MMLLAAIMGGLQPSPIPPVPNSATLGRTAWIFSTIGHSEFCPPGNVTVDIRTGRYTVTLTAARRVCGDPLLQRPVRNGKLSPANLATLQAAYLRVLGQGLESKVCRDGGHPQEIIVDNGGTPLMALTTGQATGWPPEDIACWSEAATALHDLLDHIFPGADE